MTKALLKKQLLEVFSSFNQQNTGKRKAIIKSKGIVGTVLLYIFIFAVLGSMFFMMALGMCQALVGAKMDWMYFALTSLIAILFGTFGSVFSTFTTLYQAKDNDMLLSMPIKPGKLLLVRLTGVYSMGLLYELIVMIPVLLAYYITAPLNVMSVLLSILSTLVISVVILILSIILGFVVAVISSKLENKSIITVIVSLVFLGGYVYLFGQANAMLESIIAAPQATADFIRSYAYPLYAMGYGAQGDLLSFVIFTGGVLAVFALVYLVLAKSYIRISTTNKGTTKKKYKEQTAKLGTADNALFRKELKRFTSSPNYMLNCALGTLFMVISAVAIVIKGDILKATLGLLGLGGDFISLILCAGICLIATMNDITAPSVSLEGKNIWLAQVFPVTGWQVLKAKLKLHLAITIIPVLLLCAGVIIVMRPDVMFSILIPVIAVLFTVLMAQIGLALDVRKPDLDWTTEIKPIKQNITVMIALFGGWVIDFALFIPYFAVSTFMPAFAYTIIVAVLIAVLNMILFMWLKNKGAKRFEQL